MTARIRRKCSEHTAPQNEPEVEATVELGDDEDSEVEEVSENNAEAE